MGLLQSKVLSKPFGIFSPTSKYCPNLSASSVQLSSIVQNFYPNKSKTYNSFPSSGGLCWEPTFSLWYMKLPCLQARFMRQDSVKSLFQGWREDKTKIGWPCVPQRPKQKIFFSLNSTHQIYLGCTTVVTKHNWVLNLRLPNKLIMITVMLHKMKAQKCSYIYRNNYTCLQKHFTKKKLKETS